MWSLTGILAGGLTVQLSAVWLGGAELWSKPALAFLAVAALIMMLYVRFGTSPNREVAFYAIGLALFAVLMVGLRAGDVVVQHTGDLGYLGRCVVADVIYPRWLVGSAISSFAYSSLASHPFLQQEFSAVMLADAWVRLSGAGVMVLATWYLLRIDGPRLRILLPALSPLWLLFASGYHEYYPLVGWVPVAVAAWGILDPFPKTAGAVVLAGIVAGGLSPLYIGFAPLGVAMIVVASLQRSCHAGRLLLIALASFFMLVRIAWPQSPASYFPALYASLNLGELNIEHIPYRGMSGSTYSPFFGLRYICSPEHLHDVMYMQLFGGGLVILGLLATGLLAVGWTSRKFGERNARAHLRFMARGTVLLLALIFPFVMIPKLGPRRDVDLFFWCIFLIACFAGHLFDHLSDQHPELRHPIRGGALGVVLGSSAVVLSYLTITGLP